MSDERWEHIAEQTIRKEFALRVQLAKAEARYAKVVMETNWRPIASAPKDGTKILLARIVGKPGCDTALWWAARGVWSEKWNNWNDGVEPCGLAGPTHWLPVNGYGIPLSSLADEP